MNYYFARGFSGGGSHSSFSSHSYSSSRSSSTRTSTRTSTKGGSRTSTRTSTRSTPTSGARGRAATTHLSTSTIGGRRVTGGRTVSNQHFYHYSAPAGSVVYYRQSSALDYLPWIYLFSQHNSPNNPQAIVVQPDGRQIQTQQAKHVDGMYIFEILIGLVLVAAILFGLWKIIKKARSL
jgi:cobalamin biosynthesis Mg chelatase CobN